MQSKPYYECHVTTLPKFRDVVERIAKEHKFKTSVLVGDEFMGDDKLLYCTCHERTFEVINKRMDDLVKSLTMNSCAILRKKIEFILIDERFNLEESTERGKVGI